MIKRANTAMSDRVKSKSHENRTFLERWSQRKLARRHHRQAANTNSEAIVATQQTTNSADVQLPAIESLHKDSIIDVFLADNVSESIQRQALRKLFHFGKFNICDGLDDYAEDYTIFEPLETLFAVKDKLNELGNNLNTQRDRDRDSAIDPLTSSEDTDAGSQEIDDNTRKTEQQD